jgi:hypothetical protein
MRKTTALSAARRAFCLMLAFASAAPVSARVLRVEIASRAEVLNGKKWGEAGKYEKLTGRIYFAVDPQNPHNRQIIDLDKAETNGYGEVEFSADFYVLRPKNGGNGTLLLEVPNRGGKGLLFVVQGAKGSLDPTTPEEFGDGFLLQQGYTIAWIGWQWDVRDTPGLLRLYAPAARGPGGVSLRGLVRADWTPSERRYDWPLGHLIAGNIGGTGYPVADPTAKEDVLTVRDCPTCAREVIPRTQWEFAREVEGKHVPSDRFVRLEGGFQPGKVYEIMYLAQNPVVAGLGLAAVRDFISYLKYDHAAMAPVQRAEALGVSQTGRFLRHYLFQDFNADESGRKVLDGVLAMVAGAGRGSFNHRFAQPSRDAQPTSSLFFPTDLFPFTDMPERDLLAGETAGLLDAPRRSKTVPHIFFVNTSYEYWGRTASLIHTNVDGDSDIAPGDDVRIYFAAGQGHFPAAFPPTFGTAAESRGQQKGNPNPRMWLWRALITDMNEWVTKDIAPPPSVYPRISDHTLVPLTSLAFPRIPGVSVPRTAVRAWRLDFGAQWNEGIVTREPPLTGKGFTVLVPQVDHDGTDLTGVRLPELEVPVATYTGWNLRDLGIGMPQEKISFVGSYIPFPKTAAERERTHDPRSSIAERYKSREEYLRLYREAAERLVKQRFLLPGDVPAVMQRGAQEWEVATQ